MRIFPPRNNNFKGRGVALSGESRCGRMKDAGDCRSFGTQIFIGEEESRNVRLPLLSGEDSRGSSKMGFRGKSRQRDGPGVPVLLRGHKFY